MHRVWRSLITSRSCAGMGALGMPCGVLCVPLAQCGMLHSQQANWLCSTCYLMLKPGRWSAIVCMFCCCLFSQIWLHDGVLHYSQAQCPMPNAHNSVALGQCAPTKTPRARHSGSLLTT